jgi:glutamyl-tRNA synthetase
MEDIDPPRIVRGAAQRILEDLAWLGLDWDEGPIVQSERTAIYEAALAKLGARGDTYFCDCSRKEIAEVASAPHDGELVYPGTCRDAPPDREFKRPPAIRLRVPTGEAARITFTDAVYGAVDEDVSRAVGDFVLRRGDGVFAYQLAVAIDDAEAGVTHVVRAHDLLSSTARQLLLLRMLDYRTPPSYVHVPLVVAPEGDRLAKRVGSVTVRSLAARGISPGELVGELARGLGLVDPDLKSGGEVEARDVAAALRPPSAWRKIAWPIPPEWAISRG